MRINKWVISVGLIFCIIGILLIILSPVDSIVSNIGISLFAGVIVSTAMAVLYYFNEKDRILSSIKRTIPVVYVNLKSVLELTGIILSRVDTAPLISELGYHQLTSLGHTNVAFTKECDFDGFSTIKKDSKDKRGVDKYRSFVSDLNNLEYCIMRLEKWALEADSLNYELTIKQSKGQIVSQDELGLLKQRRNLVNIQTAKIHEYEASLLNELDEIARDFYDSRKESWDSIKQSVQGQVESITQEAIG